MTWGGRQIIYLKRQTTIPDTVQDVVYGGPFGKRTPFWCPVFVAKKVENGPVFYRGTISVPLGTIFEWKRKAESVPFCKRAPK